MQYCKVTFKDAIAKYKNKEITAKGLLSFYFQIRLKPSWKLVKTARQIYALLGISKASFYNALNALKEEKVITVKETEGHFLLIRLGASILSKIVESSSKVIDKLSNTLNSSSKTVNQQSTILENEPPKPSPIKGSQKPSDSSQLYIKFISTLSQEERGRFESFCQRKIDSLSFKVASTKAWLNKHHQEYWSEFQDRYKNSLDSKIEEASKDPLLNHPKVLKALDTGEVEAVVFSSIYECNCVKPREGLIQPLAEFISTSGQESSAASLLQVLENSGNSICQKMAQTLRESKVKGDDPQPAAPPESNLENHFATSCMSKFGLANAY